MTTATARPVLFIHGLWLHPSSWDDWQQLFRDRGYEPVAPGWPGVAPTVAESRANPDAIAGRGIEEVTAHFAAVAADLPRPPLVIGHSFGGVIAQKLLGQGVAAGAVALDAAQIKGVLPVPLAQLRSAFPVFSSPKNRDRAVSLTREQFRYAFGNTLPEDESAELHDRWTIPAPGRPLFEAAVANFTRDSPAAVDTGNATRGPLLLVAGGRDHTVPESVTKSTLRQYRHSSARTELITFPDRGHSLTVDHGWRQVAETSVDWLLHHGLGPA